MKKFFSSIGTVLHQRSFLWMIVICSLFLLENALTQFRGAGQRGIFLQPLNSAAVSTTGIIGGATHPASRVLAFSTADNLVKVFDGSTLALSQTLSGSESPLQSITLSQDGRSVIGATTDGKLIIWPTAGGAMPQKFQPESKNIAGITTTAGNMILIAYADGSLDEFDWTTGKTVNTFPSVGDTITCMVLHPNGKTCALGSSQGRIHLFDLIQSPGIRVIGTPSAQITAMTFSPDGQLLVAGGADGIVHIWDWRSGILRGDLKGHRGKITTVTITNDNRLFSTATDSTLRIFNAFTRELVKSFNEPSGYYAFVSNLAQNTLCTCTQGGIVKTWRLLEAPPDTVSPSIIIVHPLVDINSPSIKIYGKEFTLEGVAYDDSAVTHVTINGKPIPLTDLDPSDTLRFPPGARTKGFKTIISLDSLGSGLLEINATDACENTASLNLYTVPLTSDQTIELVNPSENSEIEQGSIRLQFKLWFEATAYNILVNSIEIFTNRKLKEQKVGQLITEEVPLVTGFNQIQISAISKSGKRESKRFSLNRKTAAIAGTIVPPAKDKEQGKEKSEGKIQIASDKEGIGMQRWAVVVGISEYANPEISQLNYADADAKDFGAFLQSPEGGEFSNDHLRLLINKDATLANVRDGLYNFLSQAIDSDLVVIYFAGHGLPNPLRPDQLYLLTYDSDPNVLRTTAFPMWDIQTVLDRYINAKKVVVLSDACHSGGINTEPAGTRGMLTGKFNPINQYISNLSKAKDGVVVFTASGPNEVSQELTDFGHGVFTYYLLEGLRSKADINNDYVVTINEAMTYVEVQVKRKTKGAQNPTRSQTNYDKDLPMSIITH